jgi:hypothetical protein
MIAALESRSSAQELARVVRDITEDQSGTDRDADH